MTDHTIALEALSRLREGNKRFASNVRSLESLLGFTNRAAHAVGQNPLAIILGCSDSRVPAEIVFDQGLGDLFVIRVAGNIVAPSQIGSVEFAADLFGTRLVVVMGHTQCGAIKATIDELTQGVESASHNVRSITDRVRPAVANLLDVIPAHDREALIQHAGRANVRIAANQLRHGSQILERLIEQEGLLVVGAEYSLETGEVAFFDGIPNGV